MKISLALLAFSSLLIMSCSTHSVNFYQPDYAMAERFTNSCNGKGPDDHIRITLHQNVYLEASAFFSQVDQGKFRAQISYFVPQENTLRFVGKTVALTTENNLNKAFPIEQVYRFMGTEHIERQSIEGLLPGRTIPIKYFQEIRDVDVGYRVEIKEMLASSAEQFTLQLPLVEVNGQSVQTEPLQFSLSELRRSLPANCKLPQYQ